MINSLEILKQVVGRALNRETSRIEINKNFFKYLVNTKIQSNLEHIDTFNLLFEFKLKVLSNILLVLSVCDLIYALAQNSYPVSYTTPAIKCVTFVSILWL